MDSIRLFAGGLGLYLLCVRTGLWKQPVASGEGVVVIYILYVYVVLSSLSFLFVYDFLLLSLELGRCSSDLFLSSSPRTGLATTYNITGYG